VPTNCSHPTANCLRQSDCCRYQCRRHLVESIRESALRANLSILDPNTSCSPSKHDFRPILCVPRFLPGPPAKRKCGQFARLPYCYRHYQRALGPKQSPWVSRHPSMPTSPWDCRLWAVRMQSRQSARNPRAVRDYLSCVPSWRRTTCRLL
jgi:hypothetical protein